MQAENIAFKVLNFFLNPEKGITAWRNTYVSPDL